MPALRLSELDIDADTISTDLSHLNHMYSGRFSEYYYRRFDQALDIANRNKTKQYLRSEVYRCVSLIAF